MQRLVGKLYKVLSLVQWALVSLVMWMLWVLQVMDRVMVPFVMPMAGGCAAGDAVGDCAVGDVDGGAAASDVTGDGEANVADGEGVACAVTGGGCEDAVGDALGGDSLLTPMAQVLLVM